MLTNSIPATVLISNPDLMLTNPPFPNTRCGVVSSLVSYTDPPTNTYLLTVALESTGQPHRPIHSLAHFICNPPDSACLLTSTNVLHSFMAHYLQGRVQPVSVLSTVHTPHNERNLAIRNCLVIHIFALVAPLSDISIVSAQPRRPTLLKCEAPRVS